MKYTEEEKKAIENVKIILNSNIRNPFLDDEADSIDILLNLLEKQQKEIEEKDMEMELALTGKQAEIEDNMRDIIDEYYIPIEKYNELLNSKVGVNLSYDDYISKEAIREKIKELEQVKYDEGKYDEKNSIYGYIYEFSKSYEYEVAQIIIKILKELLGE